MHYRELIRNLIKTKLDGATLAGSNVFESRVYPVEKHNTPSIIIYTVSETADTNTIGGAGTSLRELILTIEIYVKKQVNPDSEIDTIAQQIEEILGQNCDLDGTVKLIDYAGIEIELNGEGDNCFFVASMNYEIIYRVLKSDPTANN